MQYTNHNHSESTCFGELTSCHQHRVLDLPIVRLDKCSAIRGGGVAVKLVIINVPHILTWLLCLESSPTYDTVRPLSSRTLSSNMPGQSVTEARAKNTMGINSSTPTRFEHRARNIHVALANLILPPHSCTGGVRYPEAGDASPGSRSPTPGFLHISTSAPTGPRRT